MLVLLKCSLSTKFTSVKEGFTVFLCLLILLHWKFLYKVDLGMDKAAAVPLLLRGTLATSFISISPFYPKFLFCELTSIKSLSFSIKLFTQFHNLPAVFLCILKEFTMSVLPPFFNFPSSNCSRRACRILLPFCRGQIFVGRFTFTHRQVLSKE